MQAAAFDAALAVARDQRLPAGRARVLSARGNLLVHLAPSPVVARVATLTAFSREDPFAWLQREVEVAGYAAGHGGPVVPPLSPRGPGVRADPGPHRNAGFAVSLWTYVPPGPAAERAGPVSAGRALALLHLSLTGYQRQLGWLTPVRDQVTEGLAALERAGLLDGPRLSALRARHAEILAGLDRSGSPPIVLHGDAHPGNLMHAGAPGWAWIDLEETCLGPREWDLAVLARSWDDPAQARAALAAYADLTATDVPTAASLGLFGQARDLEAAVWSLCMAHQYPARYQEPAADLLARVLPGSR